MANKNELRRLEITFPNFPQSYLDVVNELTCTEHDFQVCCSGAMHGNKVTIHTRITDECRAMFEGLHCVVDFKPTISEMLAQVIGILKESEDSTMELNYGTPVEVDGMMEDYIDEIRKVQLVDDELFCYGTQGCEVYFYHLQGFEQEELLENIIEQYESEDGD